MRVSVCVKQIPDPANPSRLGPDATLDRAGKAILDEADAAGVEMALRLVESAGTGEVILVSMAPEEEMAGLRSALAMGAAQAVLISDDALAGSDALGTAKVLAAAIATLDVDLVIAATESTDGYTGTVPVQVAEFLGFPAISFASEVAISGRVLRARRQTDGGYDEIELELPAVVSLSPGGVEPRYPSLRGIMSAKSKPIRHLTLADLGIEASQIGASGSRQEIVSLSAATRRRAGEVFVDDGQGHERIIALLEQLKVI